MAAEEGEQQGADVRAVHIGIRHQDDLVVAGLAQVKRTLALPVADAGADGGDDVLNGLAAQRLVQAGLLHVENLTAQGQDGLGAAVAAHLGGAACGITLHDEELTLLGVAVGAVGQLTGQTAADGHGTLAHALAGLAGRLAGAAGDEAAVDDLAGLLRVLLKVVAQLLVHHAAHHALDLRVHQLVLGLAGEARVGHLDADDGHQTLPHVIAGQARVFVLQQVVGLGVGIHRAGERTAEAGEVRAAVAVVDAVGVAEDVVLVAVVVLHHHVHDHIVLHRLAVVVNLDVAHTVHDDGLRGDEGFVLVELVDELSDAVLVEEGLPALRGGALIHQGDDQAGVKEGELAQAAAQHIEDEFRGVREDGRVRQEGDGGAGLVLRAGAHHVQLVLGLAALEGDDVPLAVAPHLGLEPIGERVHALGTHTVQTAGVLVGTLAELTAGVQVREYQLHCRYAELGVNVHGNAAPVVRHRDGAVHVHENLDVRAIAGQVLVNGVVQDLKDAMVETALIRVADIHARAFAHGFQALQLVNLGCAVFLLCPGVDSIGRHGGSFVFTHMCAYYTRTRACVNYNVRQRAEFTSRRGTEILWAEKTLAKVLCLL